MALTALAFAPAPSLVVNLSAGSPAVSDLSVTTDPVGALVYVNGKLEGPTPLSLKSIPVGDYKIRLIKDGYLENVRTVTVGGDRPSVLKVNLTRHSGGSGAAVAAPGGSKKWLLIGAGVVGAGAAAYFLTKSDPAPTPGTVTVSPTGTALAGVTSVAFSSTGASGSGTLTYTWDFGDGSTGNGQSVSHTYASQGTFNVTLTVSANGKSATAPAVSVPVRNVSASWSGRFSQSTVTLNLTQTGSTFTGTWSGTIVCGGIPGSGTVTGSLTAPRTIAVSMISAQGCTTVVLSGTLNEAISQMDGNIVSGFTSATPTYSFTRQ